MSKRWKVSFCKRLKFKNRCEWKCIRPNVLCCSKHFLENVCSSKRNKWKGFSITTKPFLFSRRTFVSLIQHLHHVRTNTRERNVYNPKEQSLLTTRKVYSLANDTNCHEKRYKWCSFHKYFPTCLSLFLFDYSCQGMIFHGICSFWTPWRTSGTTVRWTEKFYSSLIMRHKSWSTNCCICTRHLYCKSFLFRMKLSMQTFSIAFE